MSPSSFTKSQTILLVLAAMCITWIGITVQFRYNTPLTQNTPYQNQAQEPVDVSFPTFSVMGTVKDIKSSKLFVEVTGFSAPGVTEVREVAITKSTKIYAMTSPAKPSSAQTEPESIPQTPISLSDIKVGDIVSASSGKVDIQHQMQFEAESVMKLPKK